MRWALAQKIARDLSFPTERWNDPSQAMENEARWDSARRLLHDDTLKPGDHFAGLLLLLCAQWPAAISRLTTDHIEEADRAVRIRLGAVPVELPAPVADLAPQQVAVLRSYAVLAQTCLFWLFSGGQPGRPVSAWAMGERLRKFGIRLSEARPTALFRLASELPAAVLVRTPGTTSPSPSSGGEPPPDTGSPTPLRSAAAPTTTSHTRTRSTDMRLDDHRVVITAAGRDFGRTLAIRLADLGAEVFLSARALAAAERVRDEIRGRGHQQVHAFACDLTDPASIGGFAAGVARHTDRIDVLINNGSRYLEGPELQSASDADVVDTIASGATGTVLTVKNFLPLLLNSDRPDVVTMISACGTAGHHRSDAHDAFYAAKSAQAGFTEILSKRLRPQGVRVISLYPPDFNNPDPLSEQWEDTPREAKDALTAQSLVECILFAVAQPRDCFIKAFHFEQV